MKKPLLLRKSPACKLGCQPKLGLHHRHLILRWICYDYSLSLIFGLKFVFLCFSLAPSCRLNCSRFSALYSTILIQEGHFEDVNNIINKTIWRTVLKGLEDVNQATKQGVVLITLTLKVCSMSYIFLFIQYFISY